MSGRRASYWTTGLANSKLGDVTRVTTAVPPGSRDSEKLLLLTFSRPQEALARARAVLDGNPDRVTASFAHQAAGIVLREFGDSGAGLREMRAALRSARRTGLPDRKLMSWPRWGWPWFTRGVPETGSAAFERATSLATGLTAGRVLTGAGSSCGISVGYADALEDLRRAIAVLRRDWRPIWWPAMSARHTLATCT